MTKITDETLIEATQFFKEKAIYFNKLKSDESFLFNEINNINKQDIQNLEYSFSKKGPVNTLRLSVLEILRNKSLTPQIVDETINSLSVEYEKDVFRNWKANFNRFFSFFYKPLKKEIETKASIIKDYFEEKYDHELKFHYVSFSGAQHQGLDHTWFAWYSPFVDSQSKGTQFFLDINHDNFIFGKYVFSNNEYRSREIISDLGTKELKTLNDDFYNSIDLIMDSVEGSSVDNSSVDLSKQSLNQILYGPPGTGKTYKTVQKAAQIIKNNDDLDNYHEAQEIFNENLGSKIEFITFHQNYSYEDFIQGLRPDVESSGQLSFEKKDGVFTKIATEALFEYYKKAKFNELSKKNEPEKKDENEVYLDFLEYLKKLESKEFQSSSGSPISLSSFTANDNIEFKHANSSRKYLVSGPRLLKLFNTFSDMNQIKNVHNDIRDAIGGCNTTVYWVALKEFIAFYNNYSKGSEEEKIDAFEEVSYESKKKLLRTFDLDELRKVSTNEVPKYVIVIDEINRANISRVFGELITLLEVDKRSHGKIPLKCTLPSGDSFVVPSNLYIIGTMNTADKSIALLDIALRRRFEFEPMYPNYNLDYEGKEILKFINGKIIKLKGHDFQIGHAYFMADEFNLLDCFNHKIIPLLLEYFLNDESEVRNILTSFGLHLEEDTWPIRVSEIN